MPSFTCELANQLKTRLEARGANCDHWDPRQFVLPVYDPRYHDAPAENPDPMARQLISLAEQADGLVLASPVYHNSYSGVLKNILDHLIIRHVHYKPVALLSHGGNRATHAVDQLRIVVRGLLGVATPSQVCTARQDFCEEGPEAVRLVEPEICLRLDRAAAELIAFAQAMMPLHPKKPKRA